MSRVSEMEEEVGEVSRGRSNIWHLSVLFVTSQEAICRKVLPPAKVKVDEPGHVKGPFSSRKTTTTVPLSRDTQRGHLT